MYRKYYKCVAIKKTTADCNEEMKPLIFLTYSVIKKGIINYFFILLLKKFFWASKNDFRASRCWLQLARRASCKINFLCTLCGGLTPFCKLWQMET